MKITLYRNCILNNNYNEMFDTFIKDNNNKTAFDRYIANLESTVFFEVPNVYLPQIASLSFEFDIANTNYNIYDYNYMEIETKYNTIKKFKRYCFINSIKVINGLAIVEYSEDIWHTYANTMNLRKCLLTNTRSLSYTRGNTTWNIPFYKLPMEYDGNDNLNLIPVGSTQVEFAVVLQVQLYLLASGGGVGRRIPKTFVLGISNGSTIQTSNTTFTDTDFDELSELLTSLIVDSSSTQQKINYLDYVTSSFVYSPYYYEITNITFLPKNLIYFNPSPTDDSFSQLSATTKVKGKIDLTTQSGTRSLRFYEVDYIYTYSTYTAEFGKINDGRNYTINNDWLMFGVGTFDTMVETDSNGGSIKAKIQWIYDDFNLRILLSVQNKIVDITKDFQYEIPISVQTADITQQQKIAKQQKEMASALQIISGGVNVGTSIASITSGVSMKSLGQLGASSGAMTGLQGLQYVNQGKQQQSSGATGLVGGLSQIATGIAGLIWANKEVFATSKGKKGITSTLANLPYSLMKYTINPDNNTEVYNSIQNVGYIVNEYVDNEVFTTDLSSMDFNVLKFGFVRIYGKFTQAISRQLENIMEQGFKIWYDETAI